MFHSSSRRKGASFHLPDKEFRYLRTVIVTAAVYRGFGSELPPCQRHGVTLPLNLPAPGRRQSLYIDFLSLQRPVFLVNSRLGHFSAASSCFSRLLGIQHYARHPFSRSYGVNLPSSLRRDHTCALGFSPRLPVSVCGTGTWKTP